MKQQKKKEAKVCPWCLGVNGCMCALMPKDVRDKLFSKAQSDKPLETKGKRK